MGQAKNRGTFEERKDAAIKRAKADVAAWFPAVRPMPLRRIDRRLRVRVGAAAAGAVMVASIAALALL